MIFFLVAISVYLQNNLGIYIPEQNYEHTIKENVSPI